MRKHFVNLFTAQKTTFFRIEMTKMKLIMIYASHIRLQRSKMTEKHILPYFIGIDKTKQSQRN